MWRLDKPIESIIRHDYNQFNFHLPLHFALAVSWIFIGFLGFHGMLNTAVIHGKARNLGYSKPSSVNQSWVLSGFIGFLDDFEKPS